MNDTNYLDMPDHEVANLSAPLPATAAATQEVATPPVEQVQEGEAVTPPATTEVAEGAENGGGDNGAPELDAEGKPVVAAPAAGEVTEELDAEGNPVVPGSTAGKQPAAEEIDYKAQYERLFQPIKAAGKTIELKNMDEAIRLIQMGADYNRVVEGSRPMRRIEAMLRKADLLDEDNLSFLVDLHNKKPEAIAKLLAGTEINPLSLDAELAAKYVPTDRRVSDSQLNLDDAIASLEATDHGQAVLTHVAQAWDAESRKIAATSPDILNHLASHKEAGYYDQIVAEVERQKTLGHLRNVPFLSAYKQVGDMMQEAGVFNKSAEGGLAPLQPTPQKPLAPVAVRPASQPATQGNPKAVAAAAPRGAAKPAPAQVDYLNMSDADFAKLSGQQ